MNIVFLIGNGFDISLGLKTSYRDFAKYYVQKPSSHPSIEKLKKEIEECLKEENKDDISGLILNWLLVSTQKIFQENRSLTLSMMIS